MSISFDPRLSPAAPAGVTAAAAEVGRILHGLESALGTCGVTVLGRASAAELAGIVRTAFDPASRGEVNPRRAALKDAGYSILIIRHDDLPAGISALKSRLNC